jgi:hypothetical protein
VTPEVRYARSGDTSIAYQVVGDGPFADRGSHTSNGVPGDRELHAVAR